MTDALEQALRAGPGTATAPPAGRLADRAAAQGLLDVAYATIDSPLGPLVAAVTPRGLVRLAYPDEGPDAVVADLAGRISPRAMEAPRRLEPVRRELGDYFDRRRREFDLPVDWTLVRGFARQVLERTAAIPFGETLSYAEVAAGAGRPAAWRATGNALGANPIPIVIPCHRVLRTGGLLGGYTGGVSRKAFLLELEGVSPRG
jgi:methylated-DNA-[protein]-cysteine S-methyltransferase